ncbi:MAG: sigma-54 dependent transcriptional regulator [Oligoflexia bacterium]|nr:sigma-54 dependent transcriptional regulator [Oligoflexia bacterium]
MAGAPKVLAVDDNQEGLFALEQVLQKHGFSTLTASNGQEALKCLESEFPDVILLDVNMPGIDGFEVTKRIKSDPWLRYIPILLLTAKDTSEAVVEGLEKGADDFVRKPFESEELIARVRAALRTRKLYLELEQSRRVTAELQQRLGQSATFGNIIGQSSAMKEVYALLEKIKDSDVPVLISGESGTGKELVASALHFNGPRHAKSFVQQNCSAFNDQLLESELFGHVRGAFTGAIKDKPGLFEVADGGTFFLDEVGEMSPALQVKLLRVLQDGTFIPVGATKPKRVSVRIIAATHRNLREMVKGGTFREDLFYRLNVVNVKLPALRERRSDIPLLADFFLQTIAERTGKPVKSLSPDTLRALNSHDWPGNVRELQNEVERLNLMAGPETLITATHVSEHVQSASNESPVSSPSGSLKEAVERLERSMISAALARSEGNKSLAAKELGISRSNLINKVKEYGLS